MDDKTYTQFIVAQVESLRNTASAVLPADHATVVALNSCLDQLTKKAVSPDLTLPNMGVRRAQVTVDAEFDGTEFEGTEFDDFEEDYHPPVNEEVAPGVFRDGAGDVVGVVPNPDGEGFVEIGNAEESIRRVRESLADRDVDVDDDYDDGYEEDEPEIDNTISITYTRVDGEELTQEDVYTIVNHPISATLKHLGKIKFNKVTAGDTANVKTAVFEVVEEGDLPLKALAVRAVSYRGQSIFPGLGTVQAVGAINFL